MARRYVSNKNESVRMFESNFLEFFSHVHPSIPLIVYLPVVSYLLYVALIDFDLSIGTVAGLFVVGVLSWTLTEYLLHRFVFHYQPKSRWGKRLHFVLHGVHHDYPNDATRLVMPPGISIPLALLIYPIHMLVFGSTYAPATFAGMVVGYLCYDMIHYATHHFSMKRGIWKFLKQYHMRHHYNDDNTAYGVSSPIWDYVFGTVDKKLAERKNRRAAQS